MPWPEQLQTRCADTSCRSSYPPSSQSNRARPWPASMTLIIGCSSGSCNTLFICTHGHRHLCDACRAPPIVVGSICSTTLYRVFGFVCRGCRNTQKSSQWKAGIRVDSIATPTLHSIELPKSSSPSSLSATTVLVESRSMQELLLCWKPNHPVLIRSHIGSTSHGSINK
jgi:hypothetical protein